MTFSSDPGWPAGATTVEPSGFGFGRPWTISVPTFSFSMTRDGRDSHQYRLTWDREYNKLEGTWTHPWYPGCGAPATRTDPIVFVRVQP